MTASDRWPTDRLMLKLVSMLISMLVSPQTGRRLQQALNAGYRQRGENALGEPAGELADRITAAEHLVQTAPARRAHRRAQVLTRPLTVAEEIADYEAKNEKLRRRIVAHGGTPSV